MRGLFPCAGVPSGKEQDNLRRFLETIIPSPWFSKVGCPHPRDFAIIRVRSWRQAGFSDSNFFNISYRMWERLLRNAQRQGKKRVVSSVYEVADEILSRSVGNWSKAHPSG